MWITILTHRLVRLAIAVLTLTVTASMAVNAQQGATYEIVSNFDQLPFRNGRAPSSLRQALDGTFYGTTRYGGLFDRGVLFRMDVSGVVTALHSFSDAEGSQPFGLVRASNGRFYGLTEQGGQFGRGTVFTFTPGSAPTTVHAFSTETEDTPVDLFAARDGNVYGLVATTTGGIVGTIFAIDASGGYRTLLGVPASAGGQPTSLVSVSGGRFYVTAQQGEVAPEAVFTIDDAGTVTTIHNFTGADGDDSGPFGLMERSDGRLYGTTDSGGEFSQGTVYVIDLDGAYRVIHSFNESEDQPLGIDLVEAGDGNLYGVTYDRVFKIDSSDAFTILETATGAPPADLTLATDELLYGPTASGGTDEGGTIISIDPAGTRTSVYEFITKESLGRPSGVIQTRDGRFYGTTSRPAGQTATGTVFAMDAAGTRTTLHTFIDSGPFGDGGSPIGHLWEGGSPIGHLFEGANGSLYGTTYAVATLIFFPLPLLQKGQVFRIGPDGSFARVVSARAMQAGVIEARDGRLYGVATRVPPTLADPRQSVSISQAH